MHESIEFCVYCKFTIHFQSIWKRCATLENFSSTVCDHVIKFVFYTIYAGSDISYQLENVTHM